MPNFCCFALGDYGIPVPSIKGTASNLSAEARQLILNLIILQQRLEVVLRGEARVAQVAVDVSPILDATIVEKPQVLGDGERYHACLEALPE